MLSVVPEEGAWRPLALLKLHGLWSSCRDTGHCVWLCLFSQKQKLLWTFLVSENRY